MRITNSIVLILILLIPFRSISQSCTGTSTTGTSNMCFLRASQNSHLGTVLIGTWNASTIGINYGGTGATNANDALNNLLPSQTGNNGKFLITNGAITSWVTPNLNIDSSLYATRFWVNSNFTTTSQLNAVASSIPTNTNQLTNNSGFINTIIGDGRYVLANDTFPNGKIMTTNGATNAIGSINSSLNGKVDKTYNLTVNSIGGTLTGNSRNISITTTDIPEGTNQYFTNARARNSISLTTTGTSGLATYNSTTGVLNIPNYQTSSGTVTSVGLSSADLSISGSPVTTSGIITANLNNTGVVAGSYNNVTVDVKGRVTSGGALVISAPVYNISITSGIPFQPRSSGACSIVVSGSLTGSIVGVYGTTVIAMSPTQNGTYTNIGNGISYFLNTLSVNDNRDSATILVPAGYWVRVTNTFVGVGAGITSSYTRWDF